MQANPDFDIIVTGRAYDPATYVAFCAMNQAKATSLPLDSLSNKLLGNFYHMGKIMECGGLCATPKSPGAMALVYEEGVFDISPMDPMARCTPLSVAAHTLYEKSRPDLLYGPGGCLDVGQTTYEQLPDGKTVRVRGAEFILSTSESKPYTVKLEGARVIGSRTIFLGSFVDPILTNRIYDYLDTVKNRCAAQHSDMDGMWKLDFHVHGAPPRLPKAAGNGSNHCDRNDITGEGFIVGEVLADSPTLSKTIASTARIFCSHGAYRGQMATSGNFAFGIGGMTELDVGPCCQFSIYHLMNLAKGEEYGSLITTDRQKVVPKCHTTEGLFPWLVTTLDPPAIKDPDSNETTSGPLMDIRSKGVGMPVLGKTLSETSVKRAPARLQELKDVAKFIRSKNAGPFQVTFDIMFDDTRVYKAVKKIRIAYPRDDGATLPASSQ
ncbi:hypothetical protein LTR84_009102 [Exophiala bonariae]|uniref:Uncharacterized protein n=1 Tax=Exophiala bonariae TaxID=1690606 RepID=A0AAV9MVE9_9EURO|nr:hypothetical protein LTR84_009102 [Exophiala bonariae]